MDKSNLVKGALDLALDLPGIIAFSKDFFGKKIVSMLEENPRADVIRVIEAMNPASRARLMDRLDRAEKTAEPVYENTLVRGLGDILLRDEKGVVVDIVAGVRAYEWVANLNDQEFGVFVRAMQHNPITQIVRHLIEEYPKDIGYVLEMVNDHFRKVVAAYLKVSDGQIEMELQRRRDLIQRDIYLAERKGWWGKCWS